MTTDITPEVPSPSIVDSRRLMGPNLYGASTGVVLEVAFDATRADALLHAWSLQATALAAALGWGDAELIARRERNGASLYLRAPVDVLMTATEVNEQAWVAAEATVDGRDANVPTGRLRATAAAERATRPHLATVYAAASARGLTASFDDVALTVGSGLASQTWPLAAVADVSAVAWDAVHDVPIALVTGSNGKTTTTRLVAAMWRAEGRAAGWCCSDGVWVGDAQLESGDYSGPAGAREVLRDARVEAAVLETARGGMLRRGLAVNRADTAIITNISADHFGEYGIESLESLADVKAIVARALDDRGCLVLNADDPMLVDLGARLPVRLAWFSVSSEHAALDVHVATGGDAATVHDGRLLLHLESAWHDLGALDAMPLTLNGAAHHNIQNVLGAALLGAVSGISVGSIRAALRSFGASPGDNPGRLEMHRVRGFTVLTDYAHNPDGLRALCEVAAAIPARRRLLVLGQAGNRDDDQLRALARAALRVIPFDRVIIKEMPTMLRGRAEGDVPRVLADELVRLGMSSAQVEVAPSELAAIQAAVSWAQPGDVLVCPVHVQAAEVRALLAQPSEDDAASGTPRTV